MVHPTVEVRLTTWRIISFWSEPVIYVPQGVFNDYSSGQFQFGGFRVERRDEPARTSWHDRRLVPQTGHGDAH